MPPALILRKLLASSSHAVSATLLTIRARLQRLLDSDALDDGTALIETLVEDEDPG